MPKAFVTFNFSLSKADADQKLLTIQQLKVRGSSRTPLPPRDITAQPGSRGALLTWKLPDSGADLIKGWRIYKDTEKELYRDIQDPATRQHYAELSSGATPPVTNFFISAIGASGSESRKVQVQAQALAEAGAPAIPTTPPGYTSEGSGGGNQDYYGAGGETGGLLRH
jgi:hypothetical protein